jgi:Tol biopolymer transport system component
MTGRRRLAGIALVVALAASVVTVARPAATIESGKGRFAFLQTFDDGFSYQLVLTDHDGSDKRVLRRRAVGRPSFSPNRRRITFAGPLTDDSDGRYAIYVVNVDGSRLRRLTRPKFADFDPVWAPGGQRIAFSRDRAGNSRPSSCCVLMTMQADGSNKHRVPHTEGGTRPSWSPDGRQLAYQRPSGLYVVDVDGSSGRRLVPGNHVSEPSWSPDGTKIAFVSKVSPNRSRVNVIPAGGGKIHSRVRRPGLVETPTWGADNRTLFFVYYHGLGDDGRRSSGVWRSPARHLAANRLFSYPRNIYKLTYANQSPPPRDTPVTGDWDDNGTSTAGVVRGVSGNLQWRPSNAKQPTGPKRTYVVGRVRLRDRPVPGDWDGNGTTTAGIVRPLKGDLQWRFTNRFDPDGARRSFRLGRVPLYDVPIVGDWDGDGTDTAGLVRPVKGDLQFRLTNRSRPKGATAAFRVGSVRRYDVPVVGDWDGDGTDTAGLVRPVGGKLRWRVTNRRRPSRLGIRFQLGSVSTQDIPVVGDWNGDGRDSPGIVRPVGGRLRWRLSNRLDGPEVSTVFSYGRG